MSYEYHEMLFSRLPVMTFDLSCQESSDNQYNSNNKNNNNHNENRNMCIKTSLADDDALSSEASEPHSTPPSSVSSVSDDTVSWAAPPSLNQVFFNVLSVQHSIISSIIFAFHFQVFEILRAVWLLLQPGRWPMRWRCLEWDFLEK